MSVCGPWVLYLFSSILYLSWWINLWISAATITDVSCTWVQHTTTPTVTEGSSQPWTQRRAPEVECLQPAFRHGLLRWFSPLLCPPSACPQHLPACFLSSPAFQLRGWCLMHTGVSSPAVLSLIDPLRDLWGFVPFCYVFSWVFYFWAVQGRDILSARPVILALAQDFPPCLNLQRLNFSLSLGLEHQCCSLEGRYYYNSGLWLSPP